jgi:hypothetical protein
MPRPVPSVNLSSMARRDKTATAKRRNGGRSALFILTARGTGACAKTLVALLSILLLGAFTGLPNPEAAEQERTAQMESLRRCPSVLSADNRLLTERWAASEDCDKPLRTRVTDRFLGFTCIQGLSDTAACRAFLPPPGSRAFDTSRYFRCVDLGVTDTELGVVFTWMREWVEFSKACDWSRSVELPAMEVDFVRGRTCVRPGGLCFPVHLLSPIGKVRLRLSIEKALREFGMVRSGRLGTETADIRLRHCLPSRMRPRLEARLHTDCNRIFIQGWPSSASMHIFWT